MKDNIREKVLAERLRLRDNIRKIGRKVLVKGKDKG